jgi:hypothetical protein
VVAFQKNLVAAADAHHLVADFIEARGWIAGAEEREDGRAQQDGFREFVSELPTSRRRREKACPELAEGCGTPLRR